MLSGPVGWWQPPALLTVSENALAAPHWLFDLFVPFCFNATVGMVAAAVSNRKLLYRWIARPPGYSATAMRRYGPWPPANDPTTENRQRVAHPLRTDCLSGSFSTLPETPNCGRFGESPAAGSGYQSRELGTGSQRPPSRIDCWLIRPGRVMSIASWMPSGASASPRTPLPSRTSGALRRAAAPARPCYSRSDRYHCSRARQVPP